MTTILLSLGLAFIGLLYTIFSRGRLTYMTAPEEIFPYEEKMQTLKYHILSAIILGAVFINIFLRQVQKETYTWIYDQGYLMYSILGAILVFFLIIAGFIQLYLNKTNSFFSSTKILNENQDLFTPEEDFQTNESIEDSEFWSVIDLIKFDREKSDYNFELFSNELSKRNPLWIMSFSHTLIHKKIELIKSGILKPYSFIFKKFHGEFENEFCEFIILHGKETHESVCNDLDKITTLGFEPLAIKNYDLTNLISNEFFIKTKKILISTKEFEDVSEFYDFEITNDFMKKNLPNIYSSFK